MTSEVRRYDWDTLTDTEARHVHSRYLRASTDEEGAGHARVSLGQFVSDHNRVIARVYLENARGATADRPELLRLLKDARKGDVLLVESIGRLSPPPVDDWQKLKAAIDSKAWRIVALDLPVSHQKMQDTNGDEFTGRMLGAINSMLVEMMAVIARKDYEQRRERQAQGIEKAKVAAELHKGVKELLKTGLGIRAQLGTPAALPQQCRGFRDSY